MKNPRRSSQGAARAGTNITHNRITAPAPSCQPTIEARSAAFPRAPVRFGPWSPGLDPVERVAQLRCLAGLAAVFLGSGYPLVAALHAAERDSEAAAGALEMLDRVPSLTRRRLLATFGAVTWPRPCRPRGHKQPDGTP